MPQAMVIGAPSPACRRRPAASDTGAGRVGVAAGEQHAELVAAHPRHHGVAMVGGGLGEGIGHPQDDAVAGVVTVAVVDRLEAVDVAEQQCGRARPRRGRAGSLERLLEHAPVGHPGQRIGVGERLHLGEQLRASHGGRDLVGDGPQEHAVALGEARLAGARGRPQLAPGLALVDDRDRQARLLAQRPQQLAVGGVAGGIVHPGDQRAAAVQNLQASAGRATADSARPRGGAPRRAPARRR